MNTPLIVMILAASGLTACAHTTAYRPPPAAVWLSFGPVQENADWRRQVQMFLRDDGTYATVSHRGEGDVVSTTNSVGVIPDSAMARMRALADLPQVQAYRGCGAVDGPDRLYEFRITRSSSTQRILFTYPCRPTFPAGVEKLFLAFHRGLAGVPPF